MNTPSSSNSTRKRGGRTPKASAVTPIVLNEVTTPSNGANDGAKRGVEAARKMMAKCIVDTTTASYNSRIENMKKWFKENPMEDENGNPVQLFDTDEITLKLPVPTHAVLAFFGFIGDRKVDANGNETSDAEIQKASSTMGGYRSALVHHYKQKGMKISDELDTSLSAYMSGYKRTITSLKLRGVMSIHEGKRPMEFGGYSLLAERFLRISPTTCPVDPKKKFGSWSQQLFAWPFFVLCWNLMARSVTVGNIMYQHISWSGDALTINVPKHKGDQEGAKDYPRHIYANPLQPEICPILALAVLLFSSTNRPGNGENKHQLFEGQHSESRFSAILRVVVDSLTCSEEAILGVKKKEIGTHSPRKGAPTYVLAMIEGPNPVQVFLRAGWSLGNVPDRYLFAGKGGDQLVGRTVCGLPMTDDRFAALPPHFTKATLDNISETQWAIMLPNYASYPSSLRCALPFLLASLVHHDSWLRSNLNARHPLFQSRLYTQGLYAQFKDKVLLGKVECPETRLIASGVPSHIMMSKAIRDLSARMDTLESGSKRRHEDMLGALAELKDTLPKLLRTDLLNNFQIDGAIPLTQADFMQSLDAFATRLENKFEQRIAATYDALTPQQNIATAIEQEGEFLTWNWGGRMCQMVPEGFRMPECSVKSLWDLWHFGHRQERIAPYKKLKGYNFVVKTDASELSKARRVIAEIYKMCVEKGSIVGNNVDKADVYVSGLDVLSSDSIFDAAFELLTSRLYKSTHNHRLGDLRYNYVYNLIVAHYRTMQSN